MTRVIKNRFAEHIAVKERREGRRITRRTAASESGVAKGTIDRYYHNKGDRYEIETVAKLCDYLEISVVEFFEDEVTSDDTSEQKTLLLAAS